MGDSGQIKKIIHVGYSHPTNDMRIFYKECTSLAKNIRYDVHYVTSSKNSEYDNDNIIQNNVHIHVIPLKNKRYIRLFIYLNDLRKVLEKLDGDVYHIHEPYLLPLVSKLKRNNKKVIFDSHENYYEQFRTKNNFSSRIISSIYRVYENKICKKIDAVIFPCTINGRNPFEGKCKRNILLDNYVILNEKIVPHNFNTDSFKPILCYAGTISESRGITQLIDACYQTNTKLILAGGFSSSEYENTLMGKKSFDFVDYRGVCTTDEIDKIYDDSTVGTATLLNVGQYYKVDNLSTKVYEYMQKKMPVIICDSPYAKKVVDKYKFGIAVDSKSIDEIVRAINYISDHPLEAKEMGENGYKAVIEEFNWSNEEKKLYALYEDILG